MSARPGLGRSPKAPAGTTVIAVGDIHGRLDLLQRLTEEIALEAEATAARGGALAAIFLGDYIDRGPDSAAVVEHLIRFRDQAACETIFLRGNHEDALISLVEGLAESAHWLDFGGRETMASYGVSERALKEDLAALRSQIGLAIPDTHLQFLRATEIWVEVGDYLFVHAGLDPQKPLEAQTLEDMLWGRHDEVDRIPVWPHVVVHGHTVYPRPVLGYGRIGIDTGAYASDCLTAVRLEGARQDFLKISLDKRSGEVVCEPWTDLDRTSPAAMAALSEIGARPRRGWPTKAGYAAAGLAAFALAATTVLSVRYLQPSTHVAPVSEAPEAIAAADQRAAPPAPPAQTPRASPDIAVQVLAPVDAAPVPEIAVARLEPPASRVVLRPLGAQPGDPPAAAPRAVRAPPRPSETALEAPRQTGPEAAARVQIAALRSEADARAAWGRLKARFPSQTARRSLEVQPVESGGQTLYRAVVRGFSTDAEAQSFCEALQASGQDCLPRGLTRPGA